MVTLKSLRFNGLGHGRGSRHGKDFVKLAVDELHRDLNPVQSMLAREINGALRMLKIVRLKRIGGPVSQTAQIKLRTNVLQHNLHSNEARTGFDADSANPDAGMRLDSFESWQHQN